MRTVYRSTNYVHHRNTGVDTLNGGLGDDTYSFTLGDGNDVINEAVNATSGGRPIGLSILVDDHRSAHRSADPDADRAECQRQQWRHAANGDLVINYSLTGGTTSVAQTIRCRHFAGTNAQTGVERINFNGATYDGLFARLGRLPHQQARSRQPRHRRRQSSASMVNNFIVGENGTNDKITGGSGNDLIFGGTGDNELIGGLGDDLLVGGSGAGDDDILDGGGDLDTMIGLAGNDTYIVDDIGDVVVEGLPMPAPTRWKR